MWGTYVLAHRDGSHQHVGSKCISLYNEETDELICRSCPVYGTVKGMPACALLGPTGCCGLLCRCCCGTYMHSAALCTTICIRHKRARQV